MNNSGIITQGIPKTKSLGGEKVLLFILEEIYLRENILKMKVRKEKSTLPFVYFENLT